MTLNDFKFWLAGFSEHITEAPTPAQWKRILDALEKTGQPAVSMPTVFPIGQAQDFQKHPFVGPGVSSPTVRDAPGVWGAGQNTALMRACGVVVKSATQDL